MQITLTVHSCEGTHSLELSEPCRLSEALVLSHAALAMPCGGRGRCKKCRVVAAGHLSAMTQEERAALRDEEIAAGIRLACLTTVTGSADIILPDQSGEAIVTSGALPSFALQPLGRDLGIAIDIGTTTLAGYLYDLTDGALLATASARNPQASFGADVISRLQCSHEGQRQTLAGVIRSGLNLIIDQLCDKAAVVHSRIDAAVLTGNTAMLYLLVGQPTQPLIFAPFQQDRSFGQMLPPSELDLALPGCAQVYLPRCIGAYVGADITTACMTAEFFHRTPADGPCLLIDLGTNGEMVLYHDGVCRCCSTAAGPAFEGAGIRMGMTARSGAIRAVSYESGQIVCQVVGDCNATGICGSGIIDAIAVLLECGIMDETGRLNADGHAFQDYICQLDGRPAFRFPGTSVLLTQADIRTVQMAKSAICAGILTLLQEAGLGGQVVSLKIAGGFGSFIRVHSAEVIGLIPTDFAARAESIGNAAGAGASMLLLSRKLLDESEAFSRRAELVELSTNKYFVQAYTVNMLFPKQ